MKRYSAFAIAREAFRFHSGWERAWKSPTPKAEYDVVIDTLTGETTLIFLGNPSEKTSAVGGVRPAAGIAARVPAHRARRGR